MPDLHSYSVVKTACKMRMKVEFYYYNFINYLFGWNCLSWNLMSAGSGHEYSYVVQYSQQNHTFKDWHVLVKTWIPSAVSWAAFRLATNWTVEVLNFPRDGENKTWYVDKKSSQSICIKPVDNLQQTCYHQAGARDVNASGYSLDKCNGTSLYQICWSHDPYYTHILITN